MQPSGAIAVNSKRREDVHENVKANLIHVEDREDWQENVKEYIDLKSDIKFEIIQRSSVQEIQQRLENIVGPVVVIIDLRIDHVTPIFEGYHWILERWPTFSREHPQATIFVISGQLNDAVIDTLIRRGIPENHIYHKNDWAEERDDFIAALQSAVLEMRERNGSAVSNIDQYIHHFLHGVEPSMEPTESLIFPMLIRTTTSEWNPGSVPDLEILGQIQNIYTCLGSKRTLQYLENDPEVIKVEASRRGSGYECSRSVPFVGGSVVHNMTGEQGDRALVAFVDSGIDILHEAFLKPDGTTRIKAIWDQRDPNGPAPTNFNRGTEYQEDDINAFIRSSNVPDSLKTGNDDHGTHVAGIAAGRPTNLFAGGVAPEAHIVLVIPSRNLLYGDYKSFGYCASHSLALQYISAFAKRKNLPVVINISEGHNKGPHDGTSNVEQAFDKVTNYAQEPGIVVVKSTGNERNKRIHAKLKMTSNTQEELEWSVNTSDPETDVIELWFKASTELRFRLMNPSKEFTAWVPTSKADEIGSFPSGNDYKISFERRSSDNGDSRLTVTIYRGTLPHIAMGTWKLQIVSETIKAQGEIHAWLERDEPRSTIFLNHLDEEVTLTIPSTANHVISVGSVAASTPVQLSSFSSYGPTRDGRNKPDLVAPGEGIESSASNSNSGITMMSGTSMAAPHVTGAIALLLSRGDKRIEAGLANRRLNSAQIQAALTQSVKNYTGAWNRGMGFGVLDIEAFFKEFGFI